MMDDVVEDVDLEIKKNLFDYNFGNTLVVRTVFEKLNDTTVYIPAFTLSV